MSGRAFRVNSRSSGKKKTTYYAAFLNPEIGDYNRRRALYTQDAYRKRITNRALAEEVARTLFEKGLASQPVETLSTYLSSFLAKDGRYSKSRRDQGRSLALTYLEDMYRCITKIVPPYLERLKLYSSYPRACPAESMIFGKQ